MERHLSVNSTKNQLWLTHFVISCVQFIIFYHISSYRPTTQASLWLLEAWSYETNLWLTPFRPPPLRPVAGLLAEPLLDAGAQSLLVVQPVESLQDSALVGLVFVTTRVNLWDQCIKIWVSAERTPGDQFLPARRTLFVPGEEQKWLHVISWKGCFYCFRNECEAPNCYVKRNENMDSSPSYITHLTSLKVLMAKSSNAKTRLLNSFKCPGIHLLKLL